jgi:peptide subunit release factor 1 (eRF1)
MKGIQMFLDRHLQQLAAVPYAHDHFLTLYIDTARNDEAQRDRIRLFLKHESQRIREEIGGNGHGAMVERGIHQIETFMNESLSSDTKGLAVFSCPEKDFFHAVSLPVSVNASLSIGSRPSLRPLVELRQRHPEALVVLVDAKSARVVRLQLGTAQEVADLENDETPRKHDQGGWSQANLQRHMQDHIDRHHNQAAELLGKIAGKSSAICIVLAGQERNVANFRSFLAKHIDELVLGTLHLDMRATHDEIAAAVQPLLEQHQRRQTAELLDQLSAAKSNGRGITGSQKVADAVNERKLGTLILTNAAQAQGWRCSVCGILGQTVPLGCPGCGGAVVTVDLVEEFIVAAQNEAASVRFVESFPTLDRNQGIGAILRF